jgi:outer membrane protein TolC
LLPSRVIITKQPHHSAFVSGTSRRPPSDARASSQTEDKSVASLQLPTDLPVSLPSKLVEQRPDIQAAEAQLHATSASIGVAVESSANLT